MLTILFFNLYQIRSLEIIEGSNDLYLENSRLLDQRNSDDINITSVNGATEEEITTNETLEIFNRQNSKPMSYDDYKEDLNNKRNALLKYIILALFVISVFILLVRVLYNLIFNEEIRTFSVGISLFLKVFPLIYKEIKKIVRFLNM